MAFRSDGPITVALPPFRGVTRRIVLLAVAMYFLLLVLQLVLPSAGALVAAYLSLSPQYAYKLLWQLVSYPFINVGLFTVLFAALSTWFFGAALEEERGTAWITEFFFASTIGGAVLAVVVAWTAGRTVPGLSILELGSGLWPFSLALLLAYARFHADQQLNFSFVLQVKAKYIAAIYLLVYLAVALSEHDRFNAMLVLTNALAGWLFVVFAPRRGFGVAGGGGLRNLQEAWVRSKRRRAARKFSVYMQKQGREVNFDPNGRYVDPEKGRREPGTPGKSGSQGNPKDRGWMN